MKEENMRDYNDELEEFDEEEVYGYMECGRKIKEDIKQAISEVKADEAKCPFGKRHKLLNEKYKKEIAKNTSATTGNSLSKGIIIKIGQVAFHVTGEMYYQLLKLRYIKDGSVPKIIFGNRQLLCTIAAGVIILNRVNVAKSETIEKEPINGKENISQNSESDYHEVSISDSVTLLNVHRVSGGDTFYKLSWDAGMSAEELEAYNNCSDDKLYYDTIIRIPYRVLEKDLKYYTEVAIVYDKTIGELAKEYDTDVETLVRLNNEAIEEKNGVYSILSETITVPKFISKQELQEKRAEQYRKNNQ